MPRRRTRATVGLDWGVLLATLALSACLLPQDKSPPRQDYPLEVTSLRAIASPTRQRQDPAGGDAQGRAWIRFNRIAYSREPLKLDYYNDGGWSDTPAKMLPILVRSVSKPLGRSRRWYRRRRQASDFAGGRGRDPLAAGVHDPTQQGAADRAYQSAGYERVDTCWELRCSRRWNRPQRKCLRRGPGDERRRSENSGRDGAVCAAICGVTSSMPPPRTARARPSKTDLIPFVPSLNPSTSTGDAL